MGVPSEIDSNRSAQRRRQGQLHEASGGSAGLPTTFAVHRTEDEERVDLVLRLTIFDVEYGAFPRRAELFVDLGFAVNDRELHLLFDGQLAERDRDTITQCQCFYHHRLPGGRSGRFSRLSKSIVSTLVVFDTLPLDTRFSYCGSNRTRTPRTHARCFSVRMADGRSRRCRCMSVNA